VRVLVCVTSVAVISFKLKLQLHLVAGIKHYVRKRQLLTLFVIPRCSSSPRAFTCPYGAITILMISVLSCGTRSTHATSITQQHRHAAAAMRPVDTISVVTCLANKGSYLKLGWLGSRVVSVLDSGAEGPGFKSQSRRCRVTVFGKLFTPIVPLFTKQQNW